MPLAFILLALTALLYFVPVRFRVTAFVGDKGQRLVLEMMLLYGLIRFKHRFASGSEAADGVPEAASTPRPKQVRPRRSALPPPTLSELWKKVGEYGLGITLLSLFIKDAYLDWVAHFSADRSTTRCLSLQWSTRLGLDDAAATAIATGLTYAAIGTGLGVVQEYVDFSRCRVRQISVIPSFSEAALETSLHCILDLKVGHIIVAGCQNYLLHLFRRKE